MTLALEVQQLAGSYPSPRSAVLPALQLAQARHGGWLPEQALRDVAAALGVSPAYCVSIASFYDMFRLEPTGRHLIEVCTNVSCALNGAQAVVAAFAAELDVEPGGTSPDGEFALRTVECLGGCGWATIVAVDNRHRLRVAAGDVAGIVAELRGEREADVDV